MNLEFLVPFIDKGLGVVAFIVMVWLVAQIVAWFREDQKKVLELVIKQTDVLSNISTMQAEIAKTQRDTNILLERALEDHDLLNRRKTP